MSPKPKIFLRTLLSTACAGLMLTVAQGSFAAGEETLNSTVSEQTKTEVAAIDSQKKVVQLDDQASQSLANYRQMITESQSLKGYNDQIDLQVASQVDQITEMTEQLAVIETTSREVLPLMDKMLAALSGFVSLDIPFLPTERENRIAALEAMMARADVSTSEKYRRLVEAYQIEVEYGRTLEVYQGKVGEKTVDFLRTGRVSLMYQTLDAKETGYWNAETKQWVIDNSFKETMEKGLKIAKKQMAPDFIEVAIHTPVEVK
jgi:seryl-tRNA synthetase